MARDTPARTYRQIYIQDPTHYYAPLANPRTGGEHSGFGLEQFTPSLLFLFPFLLSLQCFQLYHGYTLLLRVVQYGASEWQLPVLGLVFLTVGVGNIVMTLRTYHQKGWSDHSKRD